MDPIVKGAASGYASGCETSAVMLFALSRYVRANAIKSEEKKDQLWYPRLSSCCSATECGCRGTDPSGAHAERHPHNTTRRARRCCHKSSERVAI
ncbi:hypothetical protein WJX72_010846 [[Myrmecia] bisecta]|uniref:Uncharacterized protein n=1 Tax=[Myrmecia] bisecta TaxID=41462 RepID=A0AAW1P7C6_9CHLO